MPDRDLVLVDSFESRKDSSPVSEEMLNIFRNFNGMVKNSNIQILVSDYETKELKPLAK